MKARRFRRTAVLALALLLPPVLAQPAEAAARVSRAEVIGTQLRIEGTALANRAITVDGVRMATSDGGGRFRVERTGYTSPADCTVDVNDGSATPVTVRLTGCTVVSAPAPAPVAALSSIAVSPTSVQGGAGSTATVRLSTAAPTGGAVVTLSSSSPAVASVPASVTVPTGATSATAPVSTNPVTATSSPVLSATYAARTVTTTLSVTPPPPPPATNTISPNVPGFAANVGTPFQETFVFGPQVASPSSFRLESGALPAGLALTQIPITSPRPFPQNAIRISGIPTAQQTSTFTLRATDANGLTATRAYTITVGAPRPLTITPQACYDPTCPLAVGSPQNLFFDGDGGVLPYSWSISAGAVPPGMSLIQDSATVGLVRIGGTPTTAGSFTFTLRVTDALGATLGRQVSVVVAPPIVPSLLELAVQPSAVGGSTVIASVRISPPAPAGGVSVALSSSNPQVASVPASVTLAAGDTIGAFPVTTTAVTQSTPVTLTGTSAGGTRTGSLTVTPPAAPAPAALVFTSETGSFDLQSHEVGQRLIPLEVGTFANRWFNGAGGVLPYRWSVAAGALPPGMALIVDSPGSAQVRIGGTPTTAGRYAFTLRLTDAAGTVVSHPVTATIGDGSVPGTTLSSLTLAQASVQGGTSVQGTVTLDVTAPADATVDLSSSSPTAALSSSITVPAGSRSAQFPISTSAVSASTPVTITAVYGATTLRATLMVTPPTTTTPPPAPAPTADTVTVSRAEYDSGKRVLRVEAASSAAGVTLRVYATATNALIGTLSGGRGEFAVASNPQSITVRSSGGGSASRQVAAQ